MHPLMLTTPDLIALAGVLSSLAVPFISRALEAFKEKILSF
jgi:hypothetical protein